MILRGLGYAIDVSDDSVTMGDAGDWDSLSDESASQNSADSLALDRQQPTSLDASSSSFSWTNLANTGVSVLQSLFRGSRSPSTTSAAQLAAASAAAQAQRTQTYLLLGGLAAAGVVGVLLLRRRKGA